MVSVIELIPNYYVKYDRHLDKKARLKLPPPVIELLKERNKYNLRDANFKINSTGDGTLVISYKGVQFAEIITDGRVEKNKIDTSSIDDFVYLSTGRIENCTPFFTVNNPDRVFVYSATDLQRVYYEIIEGKIILDSTTFRSVVIDGSHRIQLDKLERMVVLARGHGNVIIEGHPELYCFTINKPVR